MLMLCMMVCMHMCIMLMGVEAVAAQDGACSFQICSDQSHFYGESIMKMMPGKVLFRA